MKNLLKSAFSVIGAVVLLFVGLAFFVARSTSTLMVDEAERSVKDVVRETTGRIDRLMAAVEAAALNSSWVVGAHLNDPDYMYKITRDLVENNEFIVGSTVAFEPNFFKSKGRLYSPYSCISKDKTVKSFSLPYDYPTYEWYKVVKRTGHPRWCEPYFDEGGGGIMMCTFSVPVKDRKGDFYAVLTADISLEDLTAHVSKICPYPHSYAVLMSAKGEYIVKPPQDQGIVGGHETITIRDTAQNGWSVSVVCPVENVLGGARRMVFRVVVFAALGLVLIAIFYLFYSAWLQRVAARRERIASELATAWAIQMEFLPKDFPKGLCAVLRPSREVGGDLYDFVKQGDTVFFIVGDAAGKGISAALFSFKAGIVFRMCCAMKLDPGEIVRRINETLAHDNETSMFVTAFVGALNVKTGTLQFCCAGHNPPVVITPDGRASFLAVKRALPAGAMVDAVYSLQSARLSPGSKIVAYTDGVTEAERIDHMQFGNSRLVRFAASCGANDARSTTEDLLASVSEFADGVVQADDITVLTLEVSE